MKRILILTAAWTLGFAGIVLAHGGHGGKGTNGGATSTVAFQKSKSSSNRGNSSPSFIKKTTIRNQKGMPQKQRDHLMGWMSRNSVSGGQQGALTRLQTGQNLTDDDRSALTNMLASDSRLDPETRDIIKQGLDDDLATKRSQGSRQNQRYLKVKNDTKEMLTVFLQYRTQSQPQTWTWLPGDPKKSAEAVSFSVAPGKEVYAEVDKNRVISSRVRLWAKSASPNGQEWLEYKDQDLWLVPEVDKQTIEPKSPNDPKKLNEPKEHVYYAPEVQTFTFVFRS